MFSPTLLPTLKNCQPFFPSATTLSPQDLSNSTWSIVQRHFPTHLQRVGHDGRSITSRGHKRPWHQQQPKDLTPKGSPSNGFKNHLRPSKSPKGNVELTHSLFLHTVVWSPLLSRALFSPDGRTRMNRAVRKQHWTTAPVCRSAGPAR